MVELQRLCCKILVQHPEKITKLIPGISYPSSRKEVEISKLESFIKIVEEKQVEWITYKFVYGI